MSHLWPVRLVGALLAVAAVSALTTVGIALAQGGQHHAKHGRSHHAAKASARGPGSACPAPSKPTSAQQSGAVAVPGSVAAEEARAQKEALAGKTPAEKVGPLKRKDPPTKTRRQPKRQRAPKRKGSSPRTRRA
jgi:hypothetical protein